MTIADREYEAASIAAAGCYDKFEGQHKLKQIDEHIAQVEKTLASLHLMRSEIVNQYNLNKPVCDHEWLSSKTRSYCKKCGAEYDHQSN